MPPQVDVETLTSSYVGVYSDRKVSCETLAKDTGDADNDFAVTDFPPPDFPPESFWLSKDAEIDWFDRNAFLERKESGKGNQINSNTNSQRFSKNSKSKASMIGLPKTQQNYTDSKRRTNRPAANIHLFPKRSESTGKSTVSVIEPSSPKVSCMGRVRSKRYRRNSSVQKKKREKSVHKSRTETGTGERKKGFCSRMFSIFNATGSGGGDKSRKGRSEVKITKDELTTARKITSSSMRKREFPVTEPPTLGGMMKLVSGRRSSSGTTDDFDVGRL